MASLLSSLARVTSYHNLSGQFGLRGIYGGLRLGRKRHDSFFPLRVSVFVRFVPVRSKICTYYLRHSRQNIFLGFQYLRLFLCVFLRLCVSDESVHDGGGVRPCVVSETKSSWKNWNMMLRFLPASCSRSTDDQNSCCSLRPSCRFTE